MSDRTYEVSQPWVVYQFGRTHDRWWPFWNSTKFLGRAEVEIECAVCGAHEVASVRIPRFGSVLAPVSGRHFERERFLREHVHPDRGIPLLWVKPFLSPAAHRGEITITGPIERQSDE